MKRVVVTGIGIIVPGSIGQVKVWKNMSNGKVSTGKVESIDCGDLRIQIAGEIKNFEKEKYLSDRDNIKIEKLGRAESIGLASLKMAIDDSKLDIEKIKNVSLAFGMTMTNMIQSSIK